MDCCECKTIKLRVERNENLSKQNTSFRAAAVLATLCSQTPGGPTARADPEPRSRATGKSLPHQSDKSLLTELTEYCTVCLGKMFPET